MAITVIYLLFIANEVGQREGNGSLFLLPALRNKIKKEFEPFLKKLPSEHDLDLMTIHAIAQYQNVSSNFRRINDTLGKPYVNPTIHKTINSLLIYNLFEKSKKEPLGNLIPTFINEQYFTFKLAIFCFGKII